jgi:hypothetical protein
MFLQTIKLKNQFFFSFFNPTANSTFHLGHLPFKTNNYFNPWKFNSPSKCNHSWGT